MKKCQLSLLKNSLTTVSLVAMMACSSWVYADTPVNQADSQYPVIAATNTPAELTTGSGESATNQGAMTITQPTLGAPSPAAPSTDGSADTAQANSDNAASNWASLDESNTQASSSTGAGSAGDDTGVNQGESSSEAGNGDADNPSETSQAVNPTASNAADDEGDEHVVWNKRPINFVIPTGKERMISFPSAIATISADDKLTTDKLNLVYNDGTLYLKALQPFKPLLVIVHLKDSTERVLMYISSSDAADDTPVDVVISSASATRSSASKATESATSYVDLLRFAIESFYSPQRLISESVDIARAPMFTKKSVALLYGKNTEAFPRASWRGGDDFVTAVLIKNTQSHAITLDPRNVKGQWRASAFYPTNVLAPRGQRGDETTLFVISDVPFGNAYDAMPIGGQ